MKKLRKWLLPAIPLFALVCMLATVFGGVDVGNAVVMDPVDKWVIHVALVEGPISWSHTVESNWIAQDYVKQLEEDEIYGGHWAIYKNEIEYQEGRWHSDFGVSGQSSIPEPYYIDTKRGVKDISELKTALKQIKHIQEYEVRVYDCSEMSAYTEYILENKGFNVTILSNGRHAWLAVHNIADSEDVHIECTRRPHPGLKTVTPYTKSYKDIYAACGRSTNTSCPSWNWWNLLDTVKEEDF